MATKQRYVCFMTGKGTYAVPAGEVESVLDVQGLSDALLVQAVEYLDLATYHSLLERAVLLKTGQPPREYIPYVAYI